MPKGLELVSRVGEPVGDTEGLVQFCSECSAGGSPLGVPVRGLDSHRDCASDGGAVWWARVVGRSADDADDSTTDAQAESPEQPALAAEAWPPHRWVRLPEGALSRLVERETDLLEMQSLLRRSHDSERDRYFARLIGGQLAVVDTALELVASLKEQTTDVEGCAGWSHNSTIHLEMCGNCSQPRRSHPDPEPEAADRGARQCPGAGMKPSAPHGVGAKPTCPICGRAFSRVIGDNLPPHNAGRQVR